MTVERSDSENGVTLAGVSLTPREFETFRLQLLGTSKSDIGERMGISARTVDRDSFKIGSKAKSLDPNNARRGKVLMAVAAVKQGLVEFPSLPDVQLREIESRVAALVIEGVLVHEIGMRLNVHPKKAEYYLTLTYRKFGIEPYERRVNHYLQLAARITYLGLRNGHIQKDSV